MNNLTNANRDLLSERHTLHRFGTAAAAVAALRTGILMEITKGPASDRELAERLSLDLRATSLLIDLLEAIDLVRRDGPRVLASESLTALAKHPGGYELTLG